MVRLGRGKATRPIKPRRVVAKVEWHQGELYPRVGFVVTDLARIAERVVEFYNQRGTAERWIREGKARSQESPISLHQRIRSQGRALAEMEIRAPLS